MNGSKLATRYHIKFRGLEYLTGGHHTRQDVCELLRHDQAAHRLEEIFAQIHSGRPYVPVYVQQVVSICLNTKGLKKNQLVVVRLFDIVAKINVRSNYGLCDWHHRSRTVRWTYAAADKPIIHGAKIQIPDSAEFYTTGDEIIELLRSEKAVREVELYCEGPPDRRQTQDWDNVYPGLLVPY